MESSPEEKQKRRKRKGICSFFRKTWKAAKRTVLCGYRGNKVTPDTFSVDPGAHQHPADLLPGPSGLGLELTDVPVPPSVKMTLSSDMVELETSSVSGPFSLKLTPDSDPTSGEPLPVSSPSDHEPVAHQDLVDHLPGASNLELTPDTSLVDSQPVLISGQSNLKMTTDQADSETVSGSSGIYPKSMPVPEKQTKLRKKKGICSFFRQTWRASKCTILLCYRGNKVTPDTFSVDPGGHQDPADPHLGPCSLGLELTDVPGPPSVEMTLTTDSAELKSSSVSDPSSLKLTPDSDPTSGEPLPVSSPSDNEPVAHQDLVDPQPGASNLELIPDTSLVDSQPVLISGQSNLEITTDPHLGPSGLGLELTDVPGPPSVEMTLTPNPAEFETSSGSGIFSLQLTPDSDPTSGEPLPVSGPSDHKPVAHQDLVDPQPGASNHELTPDTSLVDSQPVSISGQSNLEITPDPHPGPSRLGLELTDVPGVSSVRMTLTWNPAELETPSVSVLFNLKVTTDKDPTSGEPLPVSSPSDHEPMVRQDPADPQPGASNLERTPDTNQVDSQLVCVSGQSNLMMTPDPVDPQPGPSFIRNPLSVNMIHTTHLHNPKTSSVSGPSLPELVAHHDPQPGASNFKMSPDPEDPEPMPGPSGIRKELIPVPGPPSVKMKRTTDPGEPETLSVLGHQDLVDPQPGASNLELTRDTKLVDSQPVYVSGQSRPDPTNAESMPGPSKVHKVLKPVPSPSSFGPSGGSFFSLYDVGGLLGKGSYGTVHEGIRRSDGQKVAIKFVLKSLNERFIFIPGCTKPLLAEVGLNLVLRDAPKSPYIVQMHEWFEHRYRYILIMEHPHPCQTLLNFTMSRRGFLDENAARRLFRQVVLAAKHCIDLGIFHRDIKTDNILVNTKTMRLKLIDFGCGELFDTSKEHTESQRRAIRSTVRSLGILLFRIVNGINFSNIQMIPNSGTSSECCDLINRCKSNSLTLDEVLEHEWFVKGCKKKSDSSATSKKDR